MQQIHGKQPIAPRWVETIKPTTKDEDSGYWEHDETMDADAFDSAMMDLDRGLDEDAEDFLREQDEIAANQTNENVCFSSSFQ